ncbi:glycoside hydrolase family 3 C-terminal domain-containing protein [Streptomyces sp. NPDC048275]|uniref:glycoside hydrolase family 3 protein n=1 Tax=Streptomyces sp. NPDC048275 TaxID=3155629 RepID=UPI0033D412FB
MFGAGTSGEGRDVGALTLPGVQDALVEAALEAANRAVLVMVSGRPYAIGRHARKADATVQAFFPGDEGAAAIAGVFSGRINSSGRLPVQIPGGTRPAGHLPGASARTQERWRDQHHRPAVPHRPGRVGRAAPRRRHPDHDHRVFGVVHARERRRQIRVLATGRQHGVPAGVRADRRIAPRHLDVLEPIDRAGGPAVRRPHTRQAFTETPLRLLGRGVEGTEA